MPDRVPTPPRPTTDEMDIRDVFAAVGRFFKRIGTSIVVAIISLRKASRNYAKLILICMIIGAGIGYFFYRSFEPYFSSELTISSRYYSLELMKSSIVELNQLAGEGNDKILARKLNITPDQAASIRSLQIQPLVNTEDIIELEALVEAASASESLTEEQQEELRTRLLENVTKFKILTTVFSISILDPLEQGIISFLRQNEYIQRRVSIEQEGLIAMRDKLLREQERLERIKNLQAETYGRLAEATRAGSNNVILGTAERNNDPLIVYQEDLLFTEELQQVNEKLHLNQGLEIVSGFTPYGAPASLSLRGQLLLGALIGLGVAYLIILLISINQALNRYEARHLSNRVSA